MVASENLDLPMMYAVRRNLPAGTPVDLAAAVKAEWARLGLAAQAAGRRIAIGVGSRGVAGIDVTVRALVGCVRESGGCPFIVPAMGSHGGATAPGQIEVLGSLGVTESTVGCPIQASMEVVTLGHTPRGLPVYFDRLAAEADGVIITNRVKEHTDFHGPTESGLVKMLAIGLGKERGAATLHSYGITGLRDYVPEVAAVTLNTTHLLAGFASVEDGYHRAVHLEGFRPAELVEGEKRLLVLARCLLPRLPVDDIDVLVVEAMGKEISGCGMDTNVIGRLRVAGEAEPERPRVGALVVLDLTEATHGNALGVGLADFTTRRLLNKIDFNLTLKNVFTSGFIDRGRIPLVYPTDEEAVAAAIDHVFRAQPERRATARVMRIHDTLTLDTLWVSASLLADVQADSSFIAAEPVEVAWVRLSHKRGYTELSSPRT
ncbi:MAG TPA: lactate racemase domain-containing protein [Aggregatilineales bacterium]|nr:lactate racemase domain-containing protein [Aggregatilineales bacterium]